MQSLSISILMTWDSHLSSMPVLPLIAAEACWMMFETLHRLRDGQTCHRLSAYVCLHLPGLTQSF